jgi:hypothetical protein
MTTTTTTVINNWKFVNHEPFYYNNTITPQWDLIDPLGNKKSVFFSGTSFNGNSNDFELAKINFCNANSSWDNALHDPNTVFFSPALFNKYV